MKYKSLLSWPKKSGSKNQSDDSAGNTSPNNNDRDNSHSSTSTPEPGSTTGNTNSSNTGLRPSETQNSTHQHSGIQATSTSTSTASAGQASTSSTATPTVQGSTSLNRLNHQRSIGALGQSYAQQISGPSQGPLRNQQSTPNLGRMYQPRSSAASTFSFLEPTAATPDDASSLAPSSMQSSIFSSSRTAGSKSTAPSSRFSGPGSTSSKRQDAIMRVVQPAQYTPVDESQLLRSRNTQQQQRSSHFTARLGAVANPSLMPDIPVEVNYSKTTTSSSGTPADQQLQTQLQPSISSSSNQVPSSGSVAGPSSASASPSALALAPVRTPVRSSSASIIQSSSPTSTLATRSGQHPNLSPATSLRPPTQATAPSSPSFSTTSQHQSPNSGPSSSQTQGPTLAPGPVTPTVSAVSTAPATTPSVSVSQTSAPLLGPVLGPALVPTQTQSYSNAFLVSSEIKKLADTLLSYRDQANHNLSEHVVIADYVCSSITHTVASPALQNVQPGSVSIHGEPALLTIIKVVLHFVDNLLQTSALRRQRALLLQKLYSLGIKLRILQENIPSGGAVPVLPMNFAVGSIPELPVEQHVVQILELAANHASDSTHDQSGAFIAPVLRGLAPEFSVISLIFGYPELRSEHFKQTAELSELRPDIHILCQKNQIAACGAQGATLKSPYRVPVDPLAPPISMSLSRQNEAKISGTLGGYIYPKVDSSDPALAPFAKSTFGITCAHVCLESGENNGTTIAVPSTHLTRCYRDMLKGQSSIYKPGTFEYDFFRKEVDRLDRQLQQGGSQFGQVVWGERTVVGKQLSDVAIIKCNDSLTCKNYLGDDIAFSEYDPALMFDNLYVRNIVKKPARGMSVFKYGSTTKYTSGQLNGLRMIYWSDGQLQSSEFIVSSSSPGFANGGDSGAWILHKDCQDERLFPNANKSGPSLGVVGMLHSFDGERREFGLYTPIQSVLDRLEQVTNIKWGVVGIADDESAPAGGSDSSGDEIGALSDAE